MVRIAIVDDSKLARTHASAILRKAGHDVTDIDPTSLMDVLEALKAASPDVVISDYLMPLCPCTSLARTCSQDEALKGMKFIVLTAHHDADIEERLHRVGVHLILHKPSDPEVLVRAIDEVCAAS